MNPPASLAPLGVLFLHAALKNIRKLENLFENGPPSPISIPTLIPRLGRVSKTTSNALRYHLPTSKPKLKSLPSKPCETKPVHPQQFPPIGKHQPSPKPSRTTKTSGAGERSRASCQASLIWSHPNKPGCFAASSPTLFF